MKAITITLALVSLAFTACEPSQPPQPSQPSPTYTISCEIGGVWSSFQTKTHPREAFASRSGVWGFDTLDEKEVVATNCSAIIGAE